MISLKANRRKTSVRGVNWCTLSLAVPLIGTAGALISFEGI